MRMLTESLSRMVAEWHYEETQDDMSNGVIRLAWKLSDNEVNFGSPYEGAQSATLRLRVHPRWGKAAYVQIQRGQLICNPYDDCHVLVRFDDGVSQRFSTSQPADHSTETMFINNYNRFVSQLRSAKVVRVSLSIYQEGEQTFTFDVRGFDLKKFVGK